MNGRRDHEELSPEVIALIDTLESAGPPLGSVPPAEARQASDERARANAADAEVVHDVTDFVIEGNGEPIRARRYRPEGPEGSTIVFFHGGGWVLCSIETHDAWCRRLANATGATVLSFDYRLAPENPFPAAVEDAWAATRWAAEDLSGARPLIVAGDSAGANLAAVVALRAREQGLALHGQILLYPITDGVEESASYEQFGEGFYLTATSMRWFWDQYVPDRSTRANRDVSPLRATDLSGTAPALIITASHDPLRDEGEAYAKALRNAGVDVHLHRFEGMIHGFATLGVLAESADVLDLVNDALGRFG